MGREMLAALYAQTCPPSTCSASASERSKGQDLEYGEDTLEVEPRHPDAFRAWALRFLPPLPSASHRLAPGAKNGCVGGRRQPRLPVRRQRAPRPSGIQLKPTP